MSDNEYEEENLDDFMINASSVLCGDSTESEKEAIIDTLKQHLSQIFHDQNEMQNIFKILDDVIFTNDDIIKDDPKPQKITNKQPFKLYPIIYSFNPKTSYFYIDYFITSLQKCMTEENRQDFTYISLIFSEVITVFYSDDKNNKNLIKKNFLLDQQKRIKLFEKIKSEGCGYVAMVNAIFVQYHGDADAFERDFGFPMYDENGEYNFDRLLLDIYAETDDKYFLDEEYGSTSYANDVLKTYIGHEDEFRREFGVPLYQNGDNTRYNPAAQQAVLDRVGDRTVVEQQKKGINYLNFENRMQHYLKEKNVPMSSQFQEMPSTKDVKAYLKRGKSVSIIDNGFNLYDENGNIAHKNVGGHWMTITEVTDDGRYVVSSWGDKYYLKPDELTDFGIEVTDLYV